MNERFSIGRVLGTGFRVWGRNLLPFAAITLLVYTPVIVWGVVVAQQPLDAEHLDALRSWDHFRMFHALVGVLLQYFVAAALTYGVVMELRGQRASFGACIATGFARFVPALGVAFMTMLAVIGGLVLLIVPGIIVSCMLYVSTQVSVIERPGIIASLRRSRELTRGKKGAIFVIAFVLNIMDTTAFRFVEEIIIPNVGEAKYIDKWLPHLGTWIYVELARQVVWASLNAVMVAVAYFCLRSEKEGTTAAELAKVFE